MEHRDDNDDDCTRAERGKAAISCSEIEFGRERRRSEYQFVNSSSTHMTHTHALSAAPTTSSLINNLSLEALLSSWVNIFLGGCPLEIRRRMCTITFERFRGIM